MWQMNALAQGSFWSVQEGNPCMLPPKVKVDLTTKQNELLFVF